MKAAVISLGSVSSQMTVAAMRKYFERVDSLSLKEIEVMVGRESGIFCAGEPLLEYDCVLVKGSFRYANLLCSISTMLEGRVAYLPLSSNSFSAVHNKLLTHLVLQKSHLPMPKTYIPATAQAAKRLLKEVNYPVVLKFPEGTQGKGVMFAESYSSASSFLDALGLLHQPFIIQEYIETQGTDIRAFVVGDRVVAAMQRKSARNEQRANIHQGGIGRSVTLSMPAQRIAVKTAQALGADICGVDLLLSPLGPLVLEANLSPGIQGITKATGVNVADEIARFLAKRTKEELKLKGRRNTKRLTTEKNMTSAGGGEIVSTLLFRGDRIVLPDFVTPLCGFREGEEYKIKVNKGKLVIESAKKLV